MPNPDSKSRSAQAPAIRVVQVNISRGGIPKLPIPQANVTLEGIEGDRHAHPKIHGGPKKALLLIDTASLRELRQAGYEIGPGTLGENITTEGMDRTRVRIGQRYRIGEAVVEITKLRQPCNTLTPLGSGIQTAVYDEQVKAGDSGSPRWGLAGFYTAVLEEGVIRPGDSIQPVTAGEDPAEVRRHQA